MHAWNHHHSKARAERNLAPPLLLFRTKPVRDQYHRLARKGYVEFCGLAVIDNLETVAQKNLATGDPFPNLALDLAVLDLTETHDRLDWRWIDDRRSGLLSADPSLEHAPSSWRRWVDDGNAALPNIRRRGKKSSA